MTEYAIERRMLILDQALFNEAAKAPFAHLFAMTDLGNMLYDALKIAGASPMFRVNQLADPLRFSGIEISVPVPIKSTKTDLLTALECLVNEFMFKDAPAQMEMAHKAIAKAKGE